MNYHLSYCTIIILYNPYLQYQSYFNFLFFTKLILDEIFSLILSFEPDHDFVKYFPSFNLITKKFHGLLFQSFVKCFEEIFFSISVISEIWTFFEPLLRLLILNGNSCCEPIFLSCFRKKIASGNSAITILDLVYDPETLFFFFTIFKLFGFVLFP